MWPNSSLAAETLPLCYNYECANHTEVVLDDDALKQLRGFFASVTDAASEREAISHAIGLIYATAARQTPIGHDRGGNSNDDETEGRMDCIDHTSNTTGYLRFFATRGWLRYHDIGEPVSRTHWLVVDHWSADVVERADKQVWVVDAWFFDPGHPAYVTTLENWRTGDDPDG